jgi:hypothetical protein
VAGTGNPEGDWLLFSLHTIFSPSVVLNPHEVARALYGKVTIAGPSQPPTVNGTGTDSQGVPRTLSGTASGFADGAVSLTINYHSDPRTFRAGIAKDVILGVDDDETTGEAGLLAMVRRVTFTDVATAQALIAGSYLFGMHTHFVSPTNSGTDAANGTIVLNDQGGWQLDGIGSDGPDLGKFSYSGSYEFAPGATPGTFTNQLIFRAGNTNEIWSGAVDQTAKVLVILDDDVEVRAAGISPELSIAIAVRREN